jgi:peptidoglycan/LPS O-acetylase OafA/YrhL
MTAKRFPFFDLLRGVCAIIVLLCHISGATGQPYLPYGYLAVDCFFLMSGYLLGAAYERRLAGSPDRVTDMLRIRLARLYPMVFLGICVGVLATAIAPTAAIGMPGGWAILRHMAMIPLLDGKRDLYPLNNVLWSLMFEILINVWHAAVLPWLRMRVLLAIVVAGLAGLVTLLLLGYVPSQGWTEASLPIGLARVVVSYTSGLLIYRFSRNRVPAATILSPGLLAVVLLTVAVLALATPFGGDVSVVFTIAIVCPAIIFVGQGLQFGPVLDRIATAAGEMSYPLYAIHFPLVRLIDAIFTRNIATHAGRGVGWLIAIPSLVALSWLIAQYVDRPMRTALRHGAWTKGRWRNA